MCYLGLLLHMQCITVSLISSTEFAQHINSRDSQLNSCVIDSLHPDISFRIIRAAEYRSLNFVLPDAAQLVACADRLLLHVFLECQHGLVRWPVVGTLPSGVGQLICSFCRSESASPEETEMKLGIPDKLVHEPSREVTARFNQILLCKRSDVSMFG